MVKYLDLLDREIQRLNEVSIERPLNMEETKKLSLLLKHVENYEDPGDDIDIDLDLSSDEITQMLRDMKLQ